MRQREGRQVAAPVAGGMRETLRDVANPGAAGGEAEQAAVYLLPTTTRYALRTAYYPLLTDSLLLATCYLTIHTDTTLHYTTLHASSRRSTAPSTACAAPRPTRRT